MTRVPQPVHDANPMKVRAVWALLVTICLLAAGGTGRIASEDGHHATTISAAWHAAGIGQRAKAQPPLLALAVELPCLHPLGGSVLESVLESAPRAQHARTAVPGHATSPRGPPAA